MATSFGSAISDVEGTQKEGNFRTYASELYRFSAYSYSYSTQNPAISYYSTSVTQHIALYMPKGIVANSKYKKDMPSLPKTIVLKDSPDSGIIVPIIKYSLPLSVLGTNSPYSHYFMLKIKGIGAKYTQNPNFFDLISTEEVNGKPFGGQSLESAQNANNISRDMPGINKKYITNVKFSPSFAHTVIPKEFVDVIEEIFKDESFPKYYSNKCDKKQKQYVQELILTPSTLRAVPLDHDQLKKELNGYKIEEWKLLRQTITQDMLRLLSLMSKSFEHAGDDYYRWYGLESKSPGRNMVISTAGAFIEDMENFGLQGHYKAKAETIQAQYVEDVLRDTLNFIKNFNSAMIEQKPGCFDLEKFKLEENKATVTEMIKFLDNMNISFNAQNSIEKNNTEEMIAKIRFPNTLFKEMRFQIEWDNMNLDVAQL